MVQKFYFVLLVLWVQFNTVSASHDSALGTSEQSIFGGKITSLKNRTYHHLLSINTIKQACQDQFIEPKDLFQFKTGNSICIGDEALLNVNSIFNINNKSQDTQCINDINGLLFSKTVHFNEEQSLFIVLGRETWRPTINS